MNEVLLGEEGTPGHVAAVAGTADVVIRLENIVKKFGEYTAVESADFDIAEGEFFSMLGP